MSTQDYLISAYNQEHPTDKEAFLKYVESVFDKGVMLDLHTFMCNKYGLPKIGTGRTTYLSKNFVFKVPISEFGFRINDLEGSTISIDEGTEYEIPIAKSRLLPKCDIPIVVMERVVEMTLDEIDDRFGYIPSFVSAVDMGQVGLNRKGKLVAFDYAQ